MHYYFLLSSLPYLQLSRNKPFRYEQFLLYAQNEVTTPQFLMLRYLQTAYPYVSELPDFMQAEVMLQKWWEYNFSLRAVLALSRHDSGGEQNSFLKMHVSNSLAVFHAQRILEKKDPLQREYILLEGQWQMIDLLGEREYFTFCAVLLYALRLGVFTRKFVFQAARGRERFEQSSRDIMQDYDKISDYFHEVRKENEQR